MISSRITPELNDLFAARRAQCLCHVFELLEKLAPGCEIFRHAIELSGLDLKIHSWGIGFAIHPAL